MLLKKFPRFGINFNHTTDQNTEEKTNIIYPKEKKFFHIFITVLLIISVLTTVFIFGQFYNSKKEKNYGENYGQSSNIIDNSDIPIVTPTPILIPNPINGKMLLDSEYNAIKDRPFLAVIIQNHVVSRPPSGLNEADIVYETLVETNITRFMAVYWSKDAPRLQSIRSVRHYFVDILGDYNQPAFMHIGLAQCVPNTKCDPRIDTLVLMNKYSIRRLSDSVNKLTGELSFSRDKNCERVKPIEHCAYSSTQRLWGIAAQKGWGNDLSKYKSWVFTDNPRDDGKPLTQFLTHFKRFGENYDPNYSVIWKYNSEKNTYERFNADNTPYLDSNNNPITADTIIYQQIVSRPTGDHKNRQYQEVIGKGTGYVMQRGKVYPVQWNKPDFYTKTTFIDTTTGKDFEFQRGKIWVMLVSAGYSYIDQSPVSIISPSL